MEHVDYGGYLNRIFGTVFQVTVRFEFGQSQTILNFTTFIEKK